MLLGILLIVCIAIESTVLYGVYDADPVANLYDRYCMYVYIGIWSLAQLYVLFLSKGKKAFLHDELSESGWVVLPNGRKLVFANGDKESQNPTSSEYRSVPGTNSPQI